jgi:hypothetical protein
MMTFAWQFLLWLVAVAISFSPVLWGVSRYWLHRDEIAILELEAWYDGPYGKDWNAG